jgi:hypothetical protein
MAGCEAQGKAQGSLLRPGTTGEGKSRKGEWSEPSLMLRYGNSLGRVVAPGKTRGWPLKVGRRQLRTLRWLCGHRRLRSTEGTRPGHISRARNVETPSGSAMSEWRGGKPTVKEAQFLGGNRTPKKRMPAAETQRENGSILAGPPTGRFGITGRIPGLVPGCESRLTCGG